MTSSDDEAEGSDDAAGERLTIDGDGKSAGWSATTVSIRSTICAQPSMGTAVAATPRQTSRGAGLLVAGALGTSASRTASRTPDGTTMTPAPVR